MTTSPSSLFNLITTSATDQNVNETAQTLHRFGSQAGDDGAQYAASCYHALHFLQVQEFQQPGIRAQRPDKLKNWHQTRSRRQHIPVRTWCASTDTLSIISSFEETVDTTDRELETSLCRPRLSLAVTASLTARRCFSGLSCGPVQNLGIPRN